MPAAEEYEDYLDILESRQLLSPTFSAIIVVELLSTV